MFGFFSGGTIKPDPMPMMPGHTISVIVEGARNMKCGVCGVGTMRDPMVSTSVVGTELHKRSVRQWCPNCGFEVVVSAPCVVGVADLVSIAGDTTHAACWRARDKRNHPSGCPPFRSIFDATQTAKVELAGGNLQEAIRALIAAIDGIDAGARA